MPGGIRLSLLFFTNLMSKKKTIATKSKGFSFSKVTDPTQVIEHANRCCARQDFYLYPYKQIFSKKNLSYKKIVGWKTSHNLEMINNIKEFSSKLRESHPEFYQKFSIFQLTLDNEISLNNRTQEDWEIFRNQKEERHFPITRITDYFS
ncbi:MAG: hypothetical protein Tsb0015_01900 [Simkaniaceae bacterium]